MIMVYNFFKIDQSSWLFNEKKWLNSNSVKKSFVLRLKVDWWKVFLESKTKEFKQQTVQLLPFI